MSKQRKCWRYAFTTKLKDEFQLIRIYQTYFLLPYNCIQHLSTLGTNKMSKVIYQVIHTRK